MFPLRSLVCTCFVLFTALLIAACSWADRARSLVEGNSKRASAVTVGDKTFSQEDLTRFFDTRLSDFRDPVESDQVKSHLLESFIEEKLLLCQAERFNVQPNPQMVQSMLGKIAPVGADRQRAASQDPDLERSLAESLKVQQYLHDYLLKNMSISEEECQSYYQQHLAEYVRNDVVHVREILVDDKAQAERILASLKTNRNKNFAELARVYSKAPNAPDGGDLGTFETGDLPEEFEKVIFSLAPGTVGKIVHTKYGYHIFMVEEKILAHQQKFYEVKDQIMEKLSLEREREIINRELQALVNQIPVRIHRDNLDFKYMGARFASPGSAFND